MSHPEPNPNSHSTHADPSLPHGNTISHWLIRNAARSAPASFSERLEEEWSADMESRRSALSRFTFALGCCWATKVIAYEHRTAVAATVSSVAGQQLAVAYLPSENKFYTRHSTTLLLVATLHVAVFYALISTMQNTKVTLVPNFQVQQLPTQQARTPIQPPPPLKTVFPRFVVERPDYVPPGDAGDGERIFTQQKEPGTPPFSSPRAVTRVPGGPGNGFPDTDDFYPPAARRLEEQGIATVHVCVDTHGRLSAAPTILQSAGSARLDEGALQLARAGSGHYRASMEDGRAVDSCYEFRIRFQLKN